MLDLLRTKSEVFGTDVAGIRLRGCDAGVCVVHLSPGCGCEQRSRVQRRLLHHLSSLEDRQNLPW